MLRSVLCLAACLGASGLQAGAALRGVGVQRAVAPQMVAVPLSNFDGAKVGDKPVELKIAKSGAYIVQRKVVAEQANMRLGTAKAKTRSEVRGGGRKPYKQKGTGRARQGSIRTPLRRGGGVLFGPRGVGARRYMIKMNKKEKRLAISTALMSATSKMTLVEDFEEKARAAPELGSRSPHCPPSALPLSPHCPSLPPPFLPNYPAPSPDYPPAPLTYPTTRTAPRSSRRRPRRP
jgi:hypothetical protein